MLPRNRDDSTQKVEHDDKSPIGAVHDAGEGMFRMRVNGVGMVYGPTTGVDYVKRPQICHFCKAPKMLTVVFVLSRFVDEAATDYVIYRIPDFAAFARRQKC